MQNFYRFKISEYFYFCMPIERLYESDNSYNLTGQGQTPMTTLAMPQSAWKPSSKVRENFSEAVDTAASGRFVIFQRNQKRFVMQNADHLRSALVKLIHSNAQVVAENNGFSMFLPGLPISADGETFDEVLDEAVDALRDYADAWQERLYLAPNHMANAGLALLVTLASDEQLKEWLVSE